MQIEFTGAEKVLFKSTYQFAIKVLKVSEAEANEMAMNKIISKRALSKKIAKSGYKF
jgi:hypothetical protein